MEVDSEPEKPTPKPKLRPKAITKGPKGDEDEPARKEQKGAEENGRLMSLLFPADGLSLFQFTVYLSLNVLFTDQTVCLTSDWSCAPCGASHVILYSEIGVPRSQLAVTKPFATLQTKEINIQEVAKRVHLSHSCQLKPTSSFSTILKGSNQGIPKPLVPCLNSSASND